MSEQDLSLYQFGPFTLDSSGHLLLRDGKPLGVTPKALDTLLVLVQAGGRVIEKDEILKKVWPDAFVEEATLAQNIFTLRKILGLDEAGHPYIETIPRRGYRFVASVNKISPDEANAPAATVVDAATDNGSYAPTLTPTSDGSKSIAVLPLAHPSKSEDLEYIAEGMTESLINTFARVPQLRVMARSTVFRYRGKEIDPLQVGRELGVQSVLLGRVLQFGERLSINVELVDVANGWLIWGEHFDRPPSDIFEVQKEISRDICDKLQLRAQYANGSPRRLIEQHTDNAEAYRLYLRGRHHWNKRTAAGYEKAIGYFREAMEIDRNYALAYSGLADCYALQCSAFYGLQQPTQVMPRAKAAVEKALQINDTLADVHASLANIQLTYEWNWEAAEASFKRAIALDPKCAHVHHWYSHYLMIVGDADAAYEETHKALEIDPHDLTYNQHLGWYHLYTGKYDLAIKHVRSMIEQSPDFYPAHIILGIAYADKEMYTEAIEEFQEARRLEDMPPTLGYLGNVYARMGDKKRARELFNELKKKSRQQYVSAYCLAMISIGLENYDEAFQYLDEAYHEHSEWLCWVKVSSVLDPIRSDPRFNKLMNRLALPRTSHYSSL